MADKSAFTESLLTTQKTIFRLAAKKGFTQDLIHQETGLPTTSLSDWANGKTKMSLNAVRKIAAIENFPLNLLSLIFPPELAIVRRPTGVSYDEISDWAESYCAKKLAAHRADSECAEQLGPTERADLDSCVIQFPGKAA